MVECLCFTKPFVAKAIATIAGEFSQYQPLYLVAAVFSCEFIIRVTYLSSIQQVQRVIFLLYSLYIAYLAINQVLQVTDLHFC